MNVEPLKSAFLYRIRGYLDGRMDWKSVHDANMRILTENADNFPNQPALQELHHVFLIDDADDPQYRETDDEIRRLFLLAEKECAGTN